MSSVDLKDLKLYQQLYIYVIPIITNLGFINIFVVAVRLMWFEKRFKSAGTPISYRRVCPWPKPDIVAVSSLPRPDNTQDLEAQQVSGESKDADKANVETEPYVLPRITTTLLVALTDLALFSPSVESNEPINKSEPAATTTPGTHITFGQDVNKPRENSALYIPSPRERDEGTNLPLSANLGGALADNSRTCVRREERYC